MNEYIQFITGDCVEELRKLPNCSVQCCVTSPPYYGLRDYGVAGQIGLEETPEKYIEKLVIVFREVKRVLGDDGTLWLNLGDSYSGGGNYRGSDESALSSKQRSNRGSHGTSQLVGCKNTPNQKPKDLIGIPWMAAFALRSDGWWLRSDIIWHKPNPMPESVTDRPTRSHEYIFLLSKSRKYYYDHVAIKEMPSPELIKQIQDGYNGTALKDYIRASVQDASATKSRIIQGYRSRIDKQRGHGRRHNGFNDKWDALTPLEQSLCGSNKRDVWSVAPANYKEAHFATFPPKLIQPCILAGSKPGDTILDPFGGSGTTALAAVEINRKAILIEINPAYTKLAQDRCKHVRPIPIQPALL